MIIQEELNIQGRNMDRTLDIVRQDGKSIVSHLPWSDFTVEPKFYRDYINVSFIKLNGGKK